ncbi:hypothetical protein KR038_008537 [Drosophila bunnanda]|nr:hypothetical protein KR038_008537 [Drosophila bunnanda]
MKNQEPPYKILSNIPEIVLMDLVGSMPNPTTQGRKKLQEWLGLPMRLSITDGRILVGIFCCTDREANILLTSCELLSKKEDSQDSQFMGTVLVTSKHIVSICVDQPQPSNN